MKHFSPFRLNCPPDSCPMGTGQSFVHFGNYREPHFEDLIEESCAISHSNSGPVLAYVLSVCENATQVTGRTIAHAARVYQSELILSFRQQTFDGNNNGTNTKEVRDRPDDDAIAWHLCVHLAGHAWRLARTTGHSTSFAESWRRSRCHARADPRAAGSASNGRLGPDIASGDISDSLRERRYQRKHIVAASHNTHRIGLHRMAIADRPRRCH